MCSAGQRDLGRADQEQLGIGVRDRVDLLARLGEEAAADERLLAHEHRRHDRREALADELVERVLHRRDVQPHDVAEQVGEARARDARAALDVDHAARRGRGGRAARSRTPASGRLDIVVQLRVLLEHAVGGATGAGGSGASSIAVSKAASTSRSCSSSAASRSRSSAAAAISAAASRPGALGLADRLRRRVALGAQLVDLRLQRAPALVQREHLVEQAVGLAARERRAHALGLGADQADVEHAFAA